MSKLISPSASPQAGTSGNGASMSTAALVQELKDLGQDHEFYPTTDEIIRAVRRDIEHIQYTGVPVSFRGEKYRHTIRVSSVLDIGAGNGKVLAALSATDKPGEPVCSVDNCYAIEKSQRLQMELAGKAFIIGADFMQQSLFEKQIDCTFCNPPYSEFEEWVVKIVRESASKVVYLVIPQRWERSVSIQDALKYRDATHKVLGKFDFEDAEDRQARAVVHLVRVVLSDGEDDAFKRFFNEQFSGLKARFETAKSAEAESELDKRDREKAECESKFQKLVAGRDYVHALVDLYLADMARIRKNYDAVALLDADLLKEFSVYPDKIMECLKTRLSELRTTYWRELFSRLDTVTKRLCCKQRDSLLATLNGNAHVDFTVENIHAIVIWVIHHASKHIDAQLIELFDALVEKANVRNYKSNQRVFEFNRWRYEQEKPTHIALEYRIVLQHSGGIRKTEYSFDRGLEERAVKLIRDLLTVAYNLGFHCDTVDTRLWRRDSWSSGSKEIFWFTQDGKDEPLVEVKAFFNGNMHIRMHQDFALALNVENGRLRGWLHTGAEAAEELQDEKAAAVFNSNRRLGAPALPMLMAPKTEE